MLALLKYSIVALIRQTCTPGQSPGDLAKAVDPGVTLIDSGESAAAEVERMLDAHALRNPSTQRANLQFHVSDVPARFTEVGERFLGRRMGKVHRVAGF